MGFFFFGIDPARYRFLRAADHDEVTIRDAGAFHRMPVDPHDIGGGGSVASLLRLMEALAPKAKRRAPERAYWGQGDKEDRDSRFTPPEFIENIYTAFGEVDIDPCAHRLSPVVAKRRIILDEGGDGLSDDWSGRLAFVNPPFSAQFKWLQRAHQQWRAGNVEKVACLVPARTDSTWFHDTLTTDADICLLQGRVRFLDPRGGAQPTPFL